MFSILYFFFYCLQGEREREGLRKAKEEQRERKKTSLGKTCREVAKKGGCETKKVEAEREEGCCQNSFCLRGKCLRQLEKQIQRKNADTNKAHTQCTKLHADATGAS